MKITRSEFLKMIAILPAVIKKNVVVSENQEKRKMIFGWTTCLTYQTEERKLGYEYYSPLLDDMHKHGMSRLIVMMASHGYYSPPNHGLAWPAKNEKLKPQIDENAINAKEESEFFSRVIQKAHSLGIEVFIEIKYLGMIGMEKGYPGIEVLRKRDGNIIHNIRPEANDFERKAIESLHLCCDNKQSHQYMRDKIEDVLSRYINLDGIVMEHPSYARNTCYCESTTQQLIKDTGKTLDEISDIEYRKWKAVRIRDTLLDLKKLVKSINPEFKFGFYTGFSPSDGDIDDYQTNRGHNTEMLNQVGFDFVLPYCEGRHLENETSEISRVIEYLAPMDIYLHTTIRREPPLNYPLPPKGPEYIKNIISWGKEYSKTNTRFKGMTFFNEVKIPDENREAVYKYIR